MSARDFALQFHDQLAARPVWLFSTGPVGTAPGELGPSAERDCADVTRIRQGLPVRGHRVFAGKIDLHSLSAVQRASLVVHHRTPGDFRDWAAVRQWASDIADDLDRTPDPAEPPRPPSAARPAEEP